MAHLHKLVSNRLNASMGQWENVRSIAPDDQNRAVAIAVRLLFFAAAGYACGIE